MLRLNSILGLLACTALACGGDDGGDTSAQTDGSSSGGGSSSAGSSGGSSSDGSGSSDGSSSADSGSDTGGVDPTPILDREPAISHSCTEQREMTLLPGTDSSRVAGLVAVGEQFFAVQWAEDLTVASLGLDGTVGDPRVLQTMFEARMPTAVAVGDELAVVWTELGVPEQLRFARLDTSLQDVVAPHAIAPTQDIHVNVATLLPHGDGFALLFASSGDDGDTQLRLDLLDGDGGPTGDTVDLAPLGPAYGNVTAAIAPLSDGGFGVVYVHGDEQGNEVAYLALDGDGTPRGDAVRVSSPAGDGVSAGFGPEPRPVLLPVGDSLWLSFTEGTTDQVAMQGSSIVKLAVLEPDGSAAVHDLQAPVEGIENVWPSLLAFDDRVGLSWTSGTIIWVCGGCIGDHDLKFVLLDPDAVVPASEVVTQLHDTNGIVGPLLATHAPDLLTAASLDFHALTRAASGALRCEASP